MTVYRHNLRHAPVGLWQFDRSLADSSNNGFTLTVESGGGIAYAEIAPDVWGVYLDGVDDNLIYNTYSPALHLVGDMTIEMLVTLVAYPTSARILVSHGASGETYTTNFAYELGVIPGPPVTTRLLWENTSSGTDITHSITSTLVLGTINHLAVTRTSNVVQFYLNGRPWGSPSSTLSAPDGGESGRFRVGDPTASTYAPNCILSSLKVIPRALSAAEIKAEYGRTLGTNYSSYSPPNNFDVVCEDSITINDAVSIPVQYLDRTHSPVGLWQLNGSLADSSGNGFNLSVELGTERYAEVFPGLLGASFDGSTLLRHNAHEAALRLTGDLTLEFIMTLNTPNLVTFVSHSATPSAVIAADNTLYNVYISATWSFNYFASFSGGSNIIYEITKYAPPPYQPYHFALTRTSQVVRFYVNGQQIGATSGTLTAPDTGTNGYFRLGGSVGVAQFNGIMASVKLIGSALTSAEVLAEYNRTVGRFYDSLMVLT